MTQKYLKSNTIEPKIKSALDIFVYSALCINLPAFLPETATEAKYGGRYIARGFLKEALP